MRTSFFAATLATVAGVSGVALPQQTPGATAPQPLPLSVYVDAPKLLHPVPLEVAAAKYKNVTGQVLKEVKDRIGEIKSNIKDIKNEIKNEIKDDKNVIKGRGTCTNLRIRIEWDSYSQDDRYAFTNAIRCLMGRRPSGQFGNSFSRYEDLVALHQTLTLNVHNNHKFLIWHRYFLWTFEDILRSECGFNRALPWWDETRYAGRFGTASVFNSQNLGSANPSGGCVNDGAFARLGLNVGPGQQNIRNHCLARDNNNGATSNVNSAYVNQCNAWGDYPNMASCAEGGPHAWGHNGIGGVMGDMFASPGDPVFWLHHAFIDRNFRIWQNQDGNRVRSISGTDRFGRPLTLDTTVNVYGMRPDVRIRDILDTTDSTLCYRYNY